MPSYEYHKICALKFLAEIGVTRLDVARANLVNCSIDEPRRCLTIALKQARARGVDRELSGECRVLYILVDYSSENMHDMFTQRYSKGKTGWSIMTLKCLRELFSLLYTPEYGLLVDLHVLLDMARKTCCDDEVLLDWALEVGVDKRVLEFYLKYREQLYYGLDCGRKPCAIRDLVRLSRGFPVPNWTAMHGEAVKQIVEKYHPLVCLVAAVLGVVPDRWEDIWDYVKERFYREVRRYLREVGEEGAELLKTIIACETLWKTARWLAEDLAHAGYAVAREDGFIVIDWNACNYILRLALDEAKRYLEECRRSVSSAPPPDLENTICNLINVINGFKDIDS